MTGRSRAIAVLDDVSRQWRLMVRCLQGQIDVLIRRHDRDVEEQAIIHRYQALVRPDQGNALILPAQTYSAGGFIIIDAASVIEPLGQARRLEISMTGTGGEAKQTFLFEADEPSKALAPLHWFCRASQS